MDFDALLTGVPPGSQHEAFETSEFYASLRSLGVTRYDRPETYNFYRKWYDRYVSASGSQTTPDYVREILEADAQTLQTTGNSGSVWIRGGFLGSGGQANVSLWARQTPLDTNGPPVQLAVKDSKWDHFWKDKSTEGTLIRKLNDLGCKNVITVYDWIYKPAPSGEPKESVIRVCEEFAAHGDLHNLHSFYTQNKLVIPEAFIWHVFWSAASALCYCRHGTKKSANTIAGWDPITHMDVKDPNILLTHPNPSVSADYPTVKLSDFGLAYTVPEKGHAELRAWKSTFKVGTASYQAPEVFNVTNSGTFRHVPPDKIHGSHSDVYSLGVTILKLIGSIDAVRTHPDVVNQRFVEDYYSMELKNLVTSCIEKHIDNRPKSYDLYRSTREGMRKYRRIARKERSDAGPGNLFHSQLLYTDTDRWRFSEGHFTSDEDALFEEGRQTLQMLIQV
ncbi:MAG: hypothetical protein Q9186_001882 [Xanthomendoza sp. 1 TL-2023]